MRKITFTFILLSLGLFFMSQNTQAQTKNVSMKDFVASVPAKWEIVKYKKENKILVSDPADKIFFTLKFISLKNGEEAMLKEVQNFMANELKNYIPKEQLGQKISVKPAKDKGLEFLNIQAKSDPDEDGEVTLYKARVYKTSKGAVMFTVLDFVQAGKLSDFYLETADFLDSIQKK